MLFQFRKMNNRWVYCALILLSCVASYAQENELSIVDLVDQALVGNHRETLNIARDQYRHPKETLQYFGLKPDMTVVEIWPSQGWYTEILAPILREQGALYAAGFSITAERPPAWRKKMQKAFEAKLTAHPRVYDKVIVTELSVPEQVDIAPENSTDMVLTFRNVHNWMKGDYADELFNAMYRALKPGGILGVVEHRAKPRTLVETMIETGYVTEEYVIVLAAQAGFIFAGRSEINANPKDSKDHPKGVWTLPPTLRLGQEDVKKYVGIGESDRMTLKFIKPMCY